MVINGGSRSGSSSYTSYLGTHLQRSDTNERVLIRELDGIIAGSVHAALREMAAIGAGAQSERPLYHANIDWRADERMSDAQKARAIERLGQELGLADQPRLVVEHVKEGREHLHVVWLRIDAETMRTIPDSHNYRKHEIVARELEREFEHARVQGAHHERDGVDRPARCPTLGEIRQAERSGMTLEEAKARLRELWQSADNGQAFVAALDNAGWTLAQGDRRGFVALDPAGEVHAVNKAITGLTAAQVRNRLADLDPGQLPSVDQVRDQLRERQQQPEPVPAPEVDREADDLAHEREANADARAADAAIEAEREASRRKITEHEAERQAAHEESLAQETQQRGDDSALNAARAVEDLARLDPPEKARNFGHHPGDRLKSPEEMRREWADLMRDGVSADLTAEARHEAENSRTDPAPDFSVRQGRGQKPDPTAERAAWADRLRGFASEPAPESRKEAEPVRARERTLKPARAAETPEKERVGIFRRLRDFVRGWFEVASRPAAPHDHSPDRGREAAGDRQAEQVRPSPALQPMQEQAPQPEPNRTPQPEQERAYPAERLTKPDFTDELLAEAHARLAKQTPEQRAERDRLQAEPSRGRGDGSRERTRHHHSPLWELAHPFHDHRSRDHHRRPGL